jgi:peptidyl-prolyl cis-trans isomerase A (cyclophilin A)
VVSIDPGRETAPAAFRARFDTSKGTFVIEAHREWAPIAADRFYNLVKNGFYDGTRFFRVRPGFMAQFGLNGNPEIQSAWQRAFLRDEPVTLKNVRGFVTFTTEGRPQSRFTQIFINFGDNSRLDADVFAPFGEVVTGMEVVDKLYSPPDEAQPDQRRILREGNEYLQKEFPQLDIVKKATIVPVTPAAPARRRPPDENALRQRAEHFDRPVDNRLGHAGHRQVVGLGPIAREHDFTRVDAEQRCGDLTRLVERLAGLARRPMRSGRVAEALGEERQHGLDRLGPHRRRRRVIEVGQLVRHPERLRGNRP